MTFELTWGKLHVCWGDADNQFDSTHVDLESKTELSSQIGFQRNPEPDEDWEERHEGNHTR